MLVEHRLDDWMPIYGPREGRWRVVSATRLS